MPFGWTSEEGSWRSWTYSSTKRRADSGRGKKHKPHQRGSVNEDRFRVRLLGIRGLSQVLIADPDLTDDQRCSLGAEFQDLAEQIIDHFRKTGKFYRRRD